jgi:predicted ABC-type ATPase
MADEMAPLARRFEAYEAEVRDYGRTWFEADAAARAVISRDAEVRAVVSRLLASATTVGTDTIYECDNRWLPERLDIHHKVVAQLFGDQIVESSGDGNVGLLMPQAVILMGMPGSGKTSMLRPIAYELLRRTVGHPHLVVDADVVRTCLPEYRTGLGSEVVQPETAFLVNGRIVEAAYSRRANLILDTVGDPDRSVAEVRYLSRAGWSIWCLCAVVNQDVAIERAQRRAIKDGRYVPLAYLRSVGDRPVRAYKAVVESEVPLAGGAMLDTNALLGSPPVVIQTTDEATFGAVGAPVVLWPEPDDPHGEPA